MNKIICIVGPTGTGKTQKALNLAKEYPSILVSADSRQVYRGMDIVTGKDHPKDITIYGIDIVAPDESCSVAVWHDTVMPYIKDAWSAGKQVIVVGGTGLYIKAITEGITTIKIPIDPQLRTELATLSIAQLQEKLKELDISKFESLNHSDVFNPRRLIRAIEIYKEPFFVNQDTVPKITKGNLIGLKYSDDEVYRSKIQERVVSRIKNGAIDETKSLLAKYDKNIQSMSAIGYKSIINYLEHNLSKDEMIEAWVADELSYSKRQLTWFRKQPVIWYDVDNIGE